jgi:hypothetical protein
MGRSRGEGERVGYWRRIKIGNFFGFFKFVGEKKFIFCQKWTSLWKIVMIVEYYQQNPI